MLLLYTEGPSGESEEPIQGQTRLMKMVFLFKKELSRRFELDQVIEDSAFPEFEAYDYGPFSAQVYADLEFLVNLGFVDVDLEGEPEILEEEQREFEYWTASVNSDEDLDSGYLGRRFRLTDRGKRFVQRILIAEHGITKDHLKVVSDFKRRCVEASLRSLLRYVYMRYSDMTKKSRIQEEILR